MPLLLFIYYLMDIIANINVIQTVGRCEVHI
jgi:hypothetical protein